MQHWISPLTADEADRRRKLSRGDVLEDGERASFSIMMMDSGRPVVGAAGDMAAQRATVEAQRKQWLADKQSAHRRREPSAAEPTRAAVPTNRAAVASARAAWLADKAGAYRSGPGEA
jgi:hypothetical protein